MATEITHTANADEYRILSLSGGGARGIFQAAVLARLESELGSPLGEAFQMIAATSTGGLIGLALARGKTAEATYSAYRRHASEVFARRRLWMVRPGPRYGATRLRELVEGMLGTDRMSDLSRDVVISASRVDTFHGRLFTRSRDPELSLVDVAMATAAAPTYFPTVVPRPHAGGYVDGGLWANDPSHVAVLHAIHELGVNPDSIKLLSVGTGRVTRGKHAKAIDKMYVVSPDTLRFVLDISSDLQAWHAATSCEQLLGPDRILRINPELPRWIRLDDAKAALEMLPGLADTAYDEHREDIATWVATPTIAAAAHGTASGPHETQQVSEVLLRGLRAGGITRFVPSRKYYSVFREGRESITSYIHLAEHTLSMVSINLATGVDMEKIVDTFTKLILHRPSPVKIRISLLNPEKPALMDAIAPVLSMPADKLAVRITDAIRDLESFADDLPLRMRTYFSLSCHNALPQASAIMIDEGTSQGLIQLESKPYASAFTDSFAWEIGYGTEFYQTIREAYSRLIGDGVMSRGNQW